MWTVLITVTIYEYNRVMSNLRFGGFGKGSCLSPGCNGTRGVSASTLQDDGTYWKKARPFCGRCAGYYKGKRTLKEGVKSVKLNYCVNRYHDHFDFTCRTRHDNDDTLPNYLLDIDHIVAEKNGGHNVPENVQTICKICHRTKSMIDGDHINTK